jgi:hypothetical protein
VIRIVVLALGMISNPAFGWYCYRLQLIGLRRAGLRTIVISSSAPLFRVSPL